MKNIEILGGGCAKCQQLQANTEAAAQALGLEYHIVKVSDLREIAKRGVMSTPGLVVDGVVKSSGRLLTPDQIKPLLG
ncbi:thioredoxin family protein [Opitutus sp. ER46]|uniref:thioredoxin family protein n=1 Tax=Opitutus sp. ER46 TaxID=2161864 RepID=UPI000D301644|nr:thioredoxin family protein [Opitutus sp. ER46]PTX92279.1 thioredoxin family protein [Opitutus sp. ER46]